METSNIDCTCCKLLWKHGKRLLEQIECKRLPVTARMCDALGNAMYIHTRYPNLLEIALKDYTYIYNEMNECNSILNLRFSNKGLWVSTKNKNMITMRKQYKPLHTKCNREQNDF